MDPTSAPDLARVLANTSPRWAKQVQPVVGMVATELLRPLPTLRKPAAARPSRFPGALHRRTANGSFPDAPVAQKPRCEDCGGSISRAGYQTILPPRSIRLLFIGEGPDVRQPRLGAGEASANVTVRGQSGELITASDGGLRLVWMEGGIRYTIQAVKGIPAGDVLRVAESLLRVVDADGRVVIH